MFDLTGKVALITGASSGIGRASAIALANQGANVALAARRIDRLTALAAEIKSRGKEALVIHADITKLDQISQAVRQTVATFKRLDILVNNAGVGNGGPITELTEEQWNTVINTNLKGYVFAAKEAAREMIKNTWGRIINIASILSGGVGVGYPNFSIYTASKGGIVGFTEALAAELAPKGILVNAIGPGLIATEMTQNIGAEEMAAILSRVPLRRIGNPEEIAAAVVFLASDEASYTTGATLYVDGGWLAS